MQDEVFPSSVLPQRRPQAITLKRAGLFRICFCPGWGVMQLIIVVVFEADGLLLVKFLGFLFQFAGVV